ncbi:MAG: XdhC family protein, partial [Myxococcota bacterium]|nr:XdhC family protein [Myxococcota bacterium]
MSDLRDVLSALAALGEDDVAVLATVVRAEGSTYRRPGARMLIRPDESFTGLISGGCLEGDLVERAQRVRESGAPALVRYDATNEDDIVWGLGLGCAGIVEILLEPVSAAEPGPLRWLERWRTARETGVIATPLDAASLGRHFGLGSEGPVEGTPPPEPTVAEAMGSALRDGRSRLARSENGPVAIEVARPPLRLVIFGAGPDAVPVARLAIEQGFQVELADPRPAYARPERFEGARVCCVPADRAVAEVGIDAETHALVMTHHYLHDQAILGDLLESVAPYIGLL